VAPPSIVVNVNYPGASASTLEDSVIAVIEREMNGSPGLIYMEAVAQAVLDVKLACLKKVAA